MTRSSRRAFIVAAISTALGLAGGSSRAQDGWDALRPPGTHAILRHANAPGTGDPANFRLDDCTTQRNLDESGRRQAAVIGEALDHAGIRIARVLTSQWCRAADTARLLDVGPVAAEPSLNSFFGNRKDEPAQTARLRDILANVGAGEKLLLVTHQVNITALTGINPASGEAIVFTIGPDGEPDVVARIRTDVPG